MRKRYTSKPEDSKQTEGRRLIMLVQAASSIVVSILTLWLAYVELGIGVFSNTITYILLVWWIYINIILLSLRWDEAKKRTTDDKIDDLITMINIQIQKSNETNNLMRKYFDERRKKG